MGLFDWLRTTAAEAKLQTALLRQIQSDLAIVKSDVEQIRRAVATSLPRPPSNFLGDMMAIAERTTFMATFIDYRATLKPVEDTENNKDVITKNLSVVVDGEVVSTQEIPRDVLDVVVSVEKGKTAALRMSYLDDDGNVGPATDSPTFTAVDTIPPDAPVSDFATLEAIREREVADTE